MFKNSDDPVITYRMKLTGEPMNFFNKIKRQQNLPKITTVRNLLLMQFKKTDNPTKIIEKSK